MLQKITLVDTPGILAGEKQRLNRGYDFTKVVGWFADRADLIIVLFDAHKLDISDELRNALDALKGHDDKIRCILNKADEIDRQRLMRVYGALLWSMGKVISTPEVLKVYVGSFWDSPLKNEDNKELFKREEEDLMHDLSILPKQSAVRKINELVKRVRKVKVLAYLVSHIKSLMPSVFGKVKKQAKIIDDLPNVFRVVMKKHALAWGDFPDLEEFKSKLQCCKFQEFKTLDAGIIKDLDRVLNRDIPKLMESLPSENDTAEELEAKMKAQSHDSESFNVPINPNNRFGDADGSDSKAKRNPFGLSESSENYWSIQDDHDFYKTKFMSSGPVSGLLHGDKCRLIMEDSGLSTRNLRDIWTLSDVDGDGCLDVWEFSLCMHLLDEAVRTGNVPRKLVKSQVPVCKRQYGTWEEDDQGRNGEFLDNAMVTRLSVD